VISENMSRYHVELNETQEYAETRFEQIHHTDVLIFGPDEFKERFLGYLKYGKDTPIADTYNYQETRCGEGESVQVISEQEASFCTLLLAFNQMGEGIIVHYPVADMISSKGTLPENIATEVARMHKFANETNGYLVITGTNTSNKERERVLGALNLGKSENIIPILTVEDRSNRRGLAGSHLANNIQGVCFIPKQLSADGRNKVILLAQRINKDGFDEVIRSTDMLNHPLKDNSHTFSVNM